MCLKNVRIEYFRCGSPWWTSLSTSSSHYDSSICKNRPRECNYWKVDRVVGQFCGNRVRMNLKWYTKIRYLLVVHFISRNPNEGEFNSTLKWEPTTPKSPKYLEIDDNPTMGTVPFPNRYEIWESLFPVKDQCKSESD